MNKWAVYGLTDISTSDGASYMNTIVFEGTYNQCRTKAKELRQKGGYIYTPEAFTYWCEKIKEGEL